MLWKLFTIIFLLLYSSYYIRIDTIMLTLTNTSYIYIDQFFLYFSLPFSCVLTFVGDRKEDDKSVFVKYFISGRTDLYEANGFKHCIIVAISEPRFDCLWSM